MTDDLESQRTTALRMLAMCTVRRARLAASSPNPTPVVALGLMNIEITKARADLVKACDEIVGEVYTEVEKLRREDA